jgi:hypothetical protein
VKSGRTIPVEIHARDTPNLGPDGGGRIASNTFVIYNL